MRVVYEGFLPVVRGDCDWDETLATVRRKSTKTLRKEHPLQCRGLKEKLTVSFSSGALAAYLGSSIVIEFALHKIATYTVAGRTVYMVVQRTSSSQQFNCHLLRFSSATKAKKFVETFTSVTKKLEKSSRSKSMFLPSLQQSWATLDDESDDEGLDDTLDGASLFAKAKRMRAISMPILYTGLPNCVVEPDMATGATRHSLIDLSTVTYDEEEEQETEASDCDNIECTVCGLGDEESDEYAHARLCDHAFHTRCYVRWKAAHNLCPECDCPLGTLYLSAKFDRKVEVDDTSRQAIVKLAKKLATSNRNDLIAARVRAVKGQKLRYQAGAVRHFASRSDVIGVCAVDDIVVIVDSIPTTDAKYAHVFVAATRAEARFVAESINSAAGSKPFEFFFVE